MIHPIDVIQLQFVIFTNNVTEIAKKDYNKTDVDIEVQTQTITLN